MATTTTVSLLGPGDAGRTMSLDEFIAAEGTGGYLYELARGVLVVTNVPRPSHGSTVRRIARTFDRYDDANPGLIRYAAGGGECRIRLRGAVSDRHPDQAIYLNRRPKGKRVWERWIPAIVVEVVSRRGEDRDYVEKREEYLRFGILEYWIFDPERRKMVVLKRAGDVWEERELGEGESHRTELLPGLEVAVAEILGPPAEEGDEEEEDDDLLDDDGPRAT